MYDTARRVALVQRGTHAELIQQKGLYADFVSARQEAIGWKLAQ